MNTNPPEPSPVYTIKPSPDLTPAQIITWNRQETFLHSFATSGSILQAAKAAGIHRDTVYKWTERDTLDFKRRLENARADFSESVEGVLFHQVFSDKPNPLLLIFTVKAHNREKYGDTLVVANDRAGELLSAVRSLPTGGDVVEGEVIRSGREEVERAVREAGQREPS